MPGSWAGSTRFGPTCARVPCRPRPSSPSSPSCTSSACARVRRRSSSCAGPRGSPPTATVGSWGCAVRGLRSPIWRPSSCTTAPPGARAFRPIRPSSAAGANACILHHVENRAPLRDGDLVLIDAGCELDGYASDITRTFPVNGRFSPPQRVLYELVLEAQRAAIAKAKPGNRWIDPHEAALKVLTKGLISARHPRRQARASSSRTRPTSPTTCTAPGTGSAWTCTTSGQYKEGGEWRLLEPGMVLTVEPGLYMPATDEVPEPYRQIGIRIEDDVLITAGRQRDPVRRGAQGPGRDRVGLRSR